MVVIDFDVVDLGGRAGLFEVVSLVVFSGEVGVDTHVVDVVDVVDGGGVVGVGNVADDDGC